jgi:A/G-specific adenine glycosylase
MDLGATVCLARVPRCDVCPLAGECPSRGTRDEPARTQSRFEGSFRQKRAEALRRVAAAAELLDALETSVVASLERDGLVVVDDDGFVRLPGG